MLQTFGILGAVVSIIAFLPYLRDILKKTTKPERASWFIWSALGSIAFFSQLYKGASDSLWMTGAQTLCVVITFLLSLRFGIGGFSKRDLLALAFAGVGLFLWYITKEPAIALFIVIIIDAIGVILTVIKSYENPGSETIITWALYGIGGFFAVLAVGSFDLVLLSYPIYIVLANASVVAAILLGRKAHK